MRTLFGLPVERLALLLLAVLVLALCVLGALAVRNRAFFRLGVRNVRRRPGRSALIVTGLMLGTAIVAAALATGDTIGLTIRSSALAALGQTDEIVSAKSAQLEGAAPGAGATGVRYVSERTLSVVERAVAGSGLVDGIAPAIVEPVAVQDARSRQHEPRVMLFASDAQRLRAFGTITTDEGRTVSLADLRAGEAYLNARAADELDAQRGDRVRVFAGDRRTSFRVRAIVEFDGTGTDGSALMLPLRSAQTFLGEPHRIKAILVSNRGDATSGAARTDDVVRRLQRALEPLGLQAATTKQDALELADTTGATFMSIFTTFGSFSIAAGILLIFLIFVMLAAERRGELGIARAVGTRRGHLVQMFLFEGVTYSLLAAALGAAVGVAVSYGMVFLMASVFEETSGIDISYSVSPSAVAVSYALGVLLTFAVVGFSAWRVSRMNIVTAIRNLPDAPSAARRHRVLAGLGALFGGLVLLAGASSKNAVPFALGASIVIASLVPFARLAGLSERAARTAGGLALVAWNLLPTPRWLLGNPKTDFSIFIVSGLMIVVGSTWTIVYNADVLLGACASSAGRVRRLAPVLRMSMAYPLRSRFRTGVTLAMFTMVVFTLVVGAIVTSSFIGGVNDVRSFGGGFDVRANVSAVAPIADMRAALRRSPTLDLASFRIVSSASSLPVKAAQDGETPQSYLVRGFDAAFLTHTTYGLAARARGYASAAAVWRALVRTPGLAVVDSMTVPRRGQLIGAVPPKFQLHGFYMEDRTFAPVHVAVRDPQTGRSVRLTVIGVLAETAPQELFGIFTSQATLAAAFGGRVTPTSYLFTLAPGADAEATAKTLESAFLAHGMQADALETVLHDAVGASLTFDRMIMGFMGLGLVVGVAALGVISARAVVERRQQIGVLRALGFRRRMVQATFLLESSFIALTSILVGTALGITLAYIVVLDSRRSPSWEHMPFAVPWATLVVVFLAVYLVALATTLAPARRASRVYPAEALRYQ
jgi:putative ABC transport system permease protein